MSPLRMPADSTDAVAAIAQRAFIEISREHARPGAANVQHHDQVVLLLAHRSGLTDPAVVVDGCGFGFGRCLLHVAPLARRLFLLRGFGFEGIRPGSRFGRGVGLGGFGFIGVFRSNMLWRISHGLLCACDWFRALAGMALAAVGSSDAGAALV